MSDSTVTVSLSDLMPNPWNPHRMTPEQMQDLEQSVLDHGQIRAVLVVEMDAPDEYSPEWPPEAPYRIVDGEHLWRVLSGLHLRGLHPDQVRVMVLGKNSDIEVWRQQEIGQTINHGLRGTEEDPEKTRQILDELLKHRKPEVLAKRLGMGVAGIRHLTEPAVARPSARPTKVKSPSLASAVKTRNPERKNYVIALVFEDADELQEFEVLIERAGEALGINRQDYAGRAGRYRIDVLTELLEGGHDPEEV